MVTNRWRIWITKRKLILGRQHLQSLQRKTLQALKELKSLHQIPSLMVGKSVILKASPEVEETLENLIQEFLLLLRFLLAKLEQNLNQLEQMKLSSPK